MKLSRLSAILAALTLGIVAPAHAASSVVMPTVGPMSFGAFNTNFLNPALLSLLQCNFGNTPPTNGPGNAAANWQCWVDTSTNPRGYKLFDGTQWVTVFTIDSTAHVTSLVASIAELVDARTTTSEAIADSDKGKLVTFNNAGAVAATIAQAGTASLFAPGWFADVQNLGAGTVTITPTVSTINGALSFALIQGQGARIVSDGTNYQVFKGNSIIGPSVSVVGNLPNWGNTTGTLLADSGVASASIIKTIDDYGAALANSGAANFTAIQAAINATPAGGTLLVKQSGYQVAGVLVINKSMKFLCANADVNIGPTFTQTTTSAGMFAIRSGYVEIENCSMQGSQVGSSTGIVIGDDAVQKVNGGSFTNASATLTCATCTFTLADVGKRIWATNVGVAGAPLFTTISALIDATHVTMANAAGATQAAQTFSYGFDYQEVVLKDLQVYNFIRGVDIVAATQFHVDHVYALAQFPLRIQNILWGDQGDGEVSGGTWFSTDNAAGAAVQYFSGGLLRFINNKVLGGLDCLQISWNYTSSNGPLLVGNSIEGGCTHGISVNNSTSLNGGTFTNNEIGIAGTPFLVSSSSTWTNWTATGNHIRSVGGNTGFDISTSSNFTIANNTFENIDGVASTAYVIRATAANGIVRPGAVSSTSSTIANLSSTTVIDDQRGMAFASLPSVAANGSRIFVTDGAPGSVPCTGSSTGAQAVRQNGAWSCSSGGVTAVQCAGVSITNAGSCPSPSISARFGGFDVWQRLVNAATTIAVPASTAAYANDGWFLLTGTAQASTITQVSGIATGSQFAAKVQRNSGQTGTAVMRYGAPLFADEIALLRGFNVALSFTMKDGANQSFSHTVGINVYCGTGAPAKRGASGYTGETTPITTTFVTSSSATRFTFTSAAVIPANCTQMEIQFSVGPTGTAGADDSFTVDDLDLEAVAAPTSVASPYPHWSYSEQLERARAVFRLLAGNQTATRLYPGLAETTAVMSVGGPLAPPMKTAPAVSFVGTAANILCNDLSVNAAFAGTFGTNFSSPTTYGFQLNCANTLTSGKAGFVNFSVGAAEALFLSSEL